MSKKAVTLLEIIIASVLLSIIMLGMMNIFFVGRRSLFHSRSTIGGGQLERVFLEPLQMHVRADTWDTAANALTIGTRYCDGSGNPQQPGVVCPPASARNLDGTIYSARYDVNEGIIDPTMRRVVVTLNWVE